MIFSQNRSSFSVSYLSQRHTHPPSFAAQNPKSQALHLHLLNHAIQFITWSYGFCPCDISNLPVYLHLCCLHPSLGCHCLLPGLMNSNWAEWSLSVRTTAEWPIQNVNLIGPPPCIKLFCHLQIHVGWGDINQNYKALHGLSATPPSSLTLSHCPFSVMVKWNYLFFLSHLCVPATGPLHLLPPGLGHSLFLYLVNSNFSSGKSLSQISHLETCIALCCACCGSTLPFIGVVSSYSCVSNFRLPPPL